jgi:hypothetical protein
MFFDVVLLIQILLETFGALGLLWVAELDVFVGHHCGF